MRRSLAGVVCLALLACLELPSAAAPADTADPAPGSASPRAAAPEPPPLQDFGYGLLAPGQLQPADTPAPASPRYVIGPGDEVVVNIWGELSLQLSLAVSAGGYLEFPDHSRLYVNGLRFGDLRGVVLAQLRQSYASALTDDKLGAGKVHLEVALGRVRGLQILVGGEVASPGRYGFPQTSATLLQALAAAGGVRTSGTLRAISVDRGGQTQTVDLYDFLVHGQADAIGYFLEEQDVVFVPLRGPTVRIEGAVRRPAIYELTEGETLRDLLEFAGGPSNRADLTHVKIERFSPGEGLEIIDLDLRRRPASKVALTFGDRVTIATAPEQLQRDIVVLRGTGIRLPGSYPFNEGITLNGLITRAGGPYEDAILDRVEISRIDPRTQTRSLLTLGLPDAGSTRLRREDEITLYSHRQVYGTDRHVRVEGHVKSPGRYPLSRELTLADLLYRAGGFGDVDLRKSTYLERASITRIDTTTGLSSLVWFNLGRVLAGLEDLALQSDDLVTVYPASYFRDAHRVQVHGAVRQPGAYDLLEGLSLGDVLRQAGGLSDAADSTRVEVFRSHTYPRQTLVVDARTDAAAFGLLAGDMVMVRTKPELRTTGVISLTGEVVYPGQYPLAHEKEQVSSVIARAGGLTENAFAQGTQLWRQIGGRPVRVAGRILSPSGRTTRDFVLSPGDSLHVPRVDWTVHVEGAVRYPGAQQYLPGRTASHYVRLAGGLLSTADTRGIHVVGPDGIAQPARRRLWFDPAVTAGSTVRVPEKAAGGSPWYRRYALGFSAGVISSGAVLLLTR